jgi:hypothetical protein
MELSFQQAQGMCAPRDFGCGWVKAFCGLRQLVKLRWQEIVNAIYLCGVSISSQRKPPRQGQVGPIELPRGLTGADPSFRAEIHLCL